MEITVKIKLDDSFEKALERALSRKGKVKLVVERLALEASFGEGKEEVFVCKPEKVSIFARAKEVFFL